VDQRFFDPRNCVRLGASRPLVQDVITTSNPAEWTVADVEAIHSQFYADVGFCPPDVRSVRLSQCGVYWWRLRQQEHRPEHRFSWMNPRDDVRKGRNPDSFVSVSDRRVVDGPGPMCEAALALFGHEDHRQQLQPTALTFPIMRGRNAIFFYGPAPPSPGAVSPLLARDVDPDYFPYGVEEEAVAFLDQLPCGPPSQ